MWDDWLGVLCSGGVCGMTGLVYCVVVVVCVWDDWLGVLCGG